MTSANVTKIGAFEMARDNFADAALAWVSALDSQVRNHTSATSELQRCRTLASLAGLAADETDQDRGEGIAAVWAVRGEQSVVAVETIDGIADQAEQGLDLAAQALDLLPADQPATRAVIVAMEALFRSIGRAADAAAADSASDLAEVWSVLPTRNPH